MYYHNKGIRRIKIKIGQRGIHKFINRLIFAQGTSEAANTLRELALKIENNDKNKIIA